MNVVTLPQGILAKVTWTSNDGRMGRDDRRSRCFERYTEAESTGEATGDMAGATTGVARRRDAAAWTRPKKASGFFGNWASGVNVLGRYTIYAAAVSTPRG